MTDRTTTTTEPSNEVQGPANPICSAADTTDPRIVARGRKAVTALLERASSGATVVLSTDDHQIDDRVVDQYSVVVGSDWKKRGAVTDALQGRVLCFTKLKGDKVVIDVPKSGYADASFGLPALMVALLWFMGAVCFLIVAVGLYDEEDRRCFMDHASSFFASTKPN